MKLKLRLLHLITLFFILCVLRGFGGQATFDVVATFDYPGFPGSYVYKINDNGLTVGTADDMMGHLYGFVRYPSGRFSRLITDPDGGGDDFTGVYGLNNLGEICGVYDGGPLPCDGFTASHGHFTTINYPGTSYTQLYGVNDAGNICGIYYNVSVYDGFVNVGGTLASFAVPGATETVPWAINNSNQCVGYYDNEIEQHGFFRDADGTITYPIDAPRATYTSLIGINDRGWMVGVAGNTKSRGPGIIFFSPTQSASYRYPGSFYTLFTGINNNGQICGVYQDKSGIHMLIVHVTQGG